MTWIRLILDARAWNNRYQTDSSWLKYGSKSHFERLSLVIFGKNRVGSPVVTGDVGF